MIDIVISSKVRSDLTGARLETLPSAGPSNFAETNNTERLEANPVQIHTATGLCPICVLVCIYKTPTAALHQRHATALAIFGAGISKHTPQPRGSPKSVLLYRPRENDRFNVLPTLECRNTSHKCKVMRYGDNGAKSTRSFVHSRGPHVLCSTSMEVASLTLCNATYHRNLYLDLERTCKTGVTERIVNVEW